MVNKDIKILTGITPESIILRVRDKSKKPGTVGLPGTDVQFSNECLGAELNEED